MNPNSPDKAVEVKSIEKATTRLENVLKDLENHISLLAGRIDPILRYDVPPVNQETVKQQQEPPCSLAKALEQHISLMVVLRLRLENLLERVEL